MLRLGILSENPETEVPVNVMLYVEWKLSSSSGTGLRLVRLQRPQHWPPCVRCFHVVILVIEVVTFYICFALVDHFGLTFSWSYFTNMNGWRRFVLFFSHKLRKFYISVRELSSSSSRLHVSHDHSDQMINCSLSVYVAHWMKTGGQQNAQRYKR